MKNNLLKKISAFSGAFLFAATLMIVGSNQKAFAGCIDKNTMRPYEWVESGHYTGYVTANGGLNVRRGPGADYSKIGWVGNGERIQVYGWNKEETWNYISYDTSNGCKVGWVSAKYLRS